MPATDPVHPAVIQSIPASGLFFLQLMLVLVFAHGCGWLFKLMKQPVVVGEIIGGILLGPGLLGGLLPVAYATCFPSTSFPALDTLSKTGITLFLFLVGMELDLPWLKSKIKRVLLVALGSMLLPFITGYGIAGFLYPVFPGVQGSGFVFALFLGTAFSITAFPVLARMVRELQAQQTEWGQIALYAAALADILAWILLALVMTCTYKQDAGTSASIKWMALLLTLGYGSLLYVLKRKRPAEKPYPTAAALPYWLLCCFTAEVLGVHALVGAFVAGITLPMTVSGKSALRQRLDPLCRWLFLPLFFAGSGMRLQWDFIQTGQKAGWFFLILLLAIISKLLGAGIPARLSGLTWPDAGRVGILMNTRGLMELVVLNIGYEMGILPPTLFAMMVGMAIFTTLLTQPLLRLFKLRIIP